MPSVNDGVPHQTEEFFERLEVRNTSPSFDVDSWLRASEEKLKEDAPIIPEVLRYFEDI